MLQPLSRGRIMRHMLLLVLQLRRGVFHFMSVWERIDWRFEGSDRVAMLLILLPRNVEGNSDLAIGFWETPYRPRPSKDKHLFTPSIKRRASKRTRKRRKRHGYHYFCDGSRMRHLHNHLHRSDHQMLWIERWRKADHENKILGKRR